MDSLGTCTHILSINALHLFFVESHVVAVQVFFSEDTNRGGYQQGQVMSKSGLNNMFDFSASLGYDYRGEWVTRKELVITIINEYGADPPPIPGIFTVSVRATGDLRNHPAACAPTVVS